jgi:hypothetical protein
MALSPTSDSLQFIDGAWWIYSKPQVSTSKPESWRIRWRVYKAADAIDQEFHGTVVQYDMVRNGEAIWRTYHPRFPGSMGWVPAQEHGEQCCHEAIAPPRKCRNRIHVWYNGAWHKRTASGTAYTHGSVA